MVGLSTLDTLARLEREMNSLNRSAEVAALHEALAALARPEKGLLTTGQAADRLGISIPTVKNWIARGTLIGANLNGRWFVTSDSIERILSIRMSFADLEGEGFPSSEEIARLRKQRRPASTPTGVA